MAKKKLMFDDNVSLNPFHSTRIAGVCVVLILTIEAVFGLLDLVGVDIDPKVDTMITNITGFLKSLSLVVLGLILVNFKV